MLRLLGTCLIVLVFLGTTNFSGARPPFEKTDTCFYTIHVPADIDVPGTPHFDTTIVRAINCKKQFLKLPEWGTQTTYTLTRMDSVVHVQREISFHFSQHYGMIDITDLPPGAYGMGLLACGNGGGFTIYLE